MKTDLVNKKEAQKRADKIKDLAFSIAEANDTLPAYSNAPECQLWIKLSNLATQLKGSEVAVFVDDLPAIQVTDTQIIDDSKVLGVICSDNLKSVAVIENELVLTYKDNVIEYFSYIEEIDAWKFKKSNSKLKIPFAHQN